MIERERWGFNAPKARMIGRLYRIHPWPRTHSMVSACTSRPRIERTGRFFDQIWLERQHHPIVSKPNFGVQRRSPFVLRGEAIEGAYTITPLRDQVQKIDYDQWRLTVRCYKLCCMGSRAATRGGPGVALGWLTDRSALRTSVTKAES